ncbi:MAG: cysteine desulfurase [Candidatus Omnitrophica bacterium]|nr:cysteine desulfurase [Candidatus Omnitrophota bacterium]
MAFVYLDHNATTPLDPQALESMQPFLLQGFGNASSLHSAGRAARSGLEASRKTLLALLGDPSGELIFTSGGTESDNLALFGAACARRQEGRRIVVSAIEHNAVISAAMRLKEEGWDVVFAPVDSQGIVRIDALKELVAPDTVLVSVMHANNEIGTLQPVQEISKIAHAQGAWMHTDAVQSFGKIPVRVQELGADLVSISAHKFYGPKGAGALYLRRGLKIVPRQVGGPHEHGLRAGTQPVAGIVGMGKAAEISAAHLDDWRRVALLRDRLVCGLQERLPGLFLNGHPAQRVANTANVSFLGCEGEDLLMALDLEGICVSTGAACSSGSTRPSHVLEAIHTGDARIRGSIRFSLGLKTTEEDVAYVLQQVPPIVERQRALAPRQADAH